MIQRAANSSTAKTRRAFTTVELLVVIAIIGMLVALLLPAVQAARESARRNHCLSNVKQVTLAMHGYADAHKSAFPIGEYGCCWGTWLVGLLPHLEQQDLYSQYRYFGALDADGGNPDPSTRYGGALNLPVTRAQLRVYTCPSDQKSLNLGLRSGVTYHNYVANHGNTTQKRVAVLGFTTTGLPNRFGGAPFIYVGSSTAAPQVVRMVEVMDGLSNTLAFSETVQGQQGDLRGFAWWNGGAHFETHLAPNSSQPDVLESAGYCVATARLNPPCTGPTTASPENIAARSRHPSGVTASLCDGSVRFISNSIYLDTWRAIGTSAGDESLTGF